MAEIKPFKQLLFEYVVILGEKAHDGCKSKSWKDYENGNGENVGEQIEELLDKTKKILQT